jgi:soluble lytic murein transglycosylase
MAPPISKIALVLAGCGVYSVSCSPRASAQAAAHTQLKQAVAALEASWPEQTLDLLDGPCAEPSLNKYWLRTKARAHIQRGKHDDAIKIYESLLREESHLDPRHPFRQNIEAELAGLLAGKDPMRAAKLLSSVHNQAEDWARAIALHKESKQYGLVETIEQRLLIKAPQSQSARQLAKKLGRVGVHKKLANTENRMNRIRNLLSAHENKNAILEAQALKEGPACEKLYIVGKAQRKLRQYRNSIKTLKRARTVCKPKSAFWMRSSLLAAQVHTIKRELGAVQGIVRMMEKKRPDHSFVDDALIQLAKAHERKKQTQKAQAIFKKILKHHESGDQTNFAAWRLAYSHIRAGHYEKAKPWLKKLRGRHAAQGLYWLARGQEKKNKSDALARYRALIFTPPLSFYSWLALSRLQKIAPKAALEAKQLLDQKRDQLRKYKDAPIKRAPELMHALRLQQIGLLEDAQAETLWWTEHHPNQSAQTQAMGVLHEMGAFSEAQHILRWSLPQKLKNFPEVKTVSNWRYAYSLAYRKEIESAAKKIGIDPLLLFALAREESTFDPKIVSWAGATGLCQLMPATGVGAYADLYRKRLTDMDKLLEPGLNAQLGAHVLKQGLKRFSGIEALALAAYNAGPRFAQRSMPKDKALDFDLWVESIGVRETRRYVKKVLQSWGRYRFFHENEEYLLTFPSHIGVSSHATAKKGDRY